ncbi:MAG: 5-oxoprolinase subunit PxpB [Chitinophagia bacterium]|nr:5-oxoprolinase subunit PxpB [Chitinophagia bacterium]
MVSLGMQSQRPTFQIQLLGDHAIVYKINTGQLKDIDPNLLAFTQFVTNEKINGIKDIILAYDTLTLVYDILHFDSNPFLFAHTILEAFNNASKNNIVSIERRSMIEIPVCYDESLGIDLENAVKALNCSIDELIQQHSEKIYTVYCLGFLPGFAYMGEVPHAIQLPRHPSPRSKVLAGSVGIAGKQTGIYPMNSPGGWQIIGRTPIKIFDPTSTSLTLFKAGDQVRFKPIDLKLFHTLNTHEDVH